MPCAQPFYSCVVLSWPGSQFSKRRPVTHELASEPHPDHLQTQLSKAYCQGRAATYPRLSLTPILLATFASPSLLSLELLKEVEGDMTVTLFSSE